MRIIFEDDVKDKPFEHFIKKNPTIIKAYQVDDDFKIYKENKGFFATGSRGDYIILMEPAQDGFYVIAKKTFEKYYRPFEVTESFGNVLSFNEHITRKEMELELE
jgi:hypothetical protein